jgi:hypothetical protein
MVLVVSNSKAAVQRWLRGQRVAARRIAHEARRARPDLADALERVDDLRRLADRLRATVEPARRERENLAFHLTWRRVRRASGIG